jgi:hypothetical protein
MFGLRNTLPITMDITPSHARAVGRIKRAFIVARFTLIVLSSTGEAVTNAGEFMCAMCAAVKHAKELDDRFIQEYGCFVCREMRNKIFGRSFDLLDPKECEDFEWRYFRQVSKHRWERGYGGRRDAAKRPRRSINSIIVHMKSGSGAKVLYTFHTALVTEEN